jgi:cell division protein FtsZ
MDLDRALAPTQGQPALGQVFSPRIKVIGLGGAGSNAVERMLAVGIPGVEYMVANTDCQALANCKAPTRIQLGPQLTRGLGAGGQAAVGREAATESRDALRSALSGAHLVFVAAGMGGGTGTGSAPVVASIARELGALTVAVVTFPFSFEGARRARTAQAGIKLLAEQTHTLIQVQNDGLLAIAPRDLRLDTAFRVADDVLRQGIQGIVELVSHTGLINLDFANVSSVILRGGHALMAIGRGEGAGKVQEAADAALHHPLLNNELLAKATAVLVHLTGGSDLPLQEISETMALVTQAAHPTAEVLFGASEDPEMEGKAQIILIAAGIHDQPRESIPVESLFGVPTPQEEDAFVTEECPAVRSILDVPAFLRRRERQRAETAREERVWATN